MRLWVFAAIPLVLAALIAGEYAAAPAPKSTRAVLTALREDLRSAYHQCVPLGWAPVPVSGTYSPGFTATTQTYDEWLDALWRGHIELRELRDRGASAVFAMLNHLAAAGLVKRTRTVSGFDYELTPRAIAYYYGSSMFHDNHDSLPYLCYSTIVPTRVDWMRRTSAKWYTLQFSWTSSAPPSWAKDPYIRSHSVTLAPITSPTTARMAFHDGEWSLANIYDRGWMLPALSTRAIMR